MPIETFNISYETTQQYGPKITCTEVRKKVIVIRNLINFLGVWEGLAYNHHLKSLTLEHGPGITIATTTGSI